MSLERWDEVWRRNQHIIAGLLRKRVVNRVLFVEPAVDTLYDLRGGSRPNLREIGLRKVDLPGVEEGRLWAFRPWKLLPRRIDPGFDRRRANKIVATAQHLGFDSPVLWINDPAGVDLLTQTGWLALYDITDDWLVAERTRAETTRLHDAEATLLQCCREVVVCSPRLVATKSHTRNVVLIPNAVDLSAYELEHTRPPDLPPGMVALYVGTAHTDRIDTDLVRNTANHLAGLATVVFVGPTPMPRELKESFDAAGVLLLGPRPSESIPAYLTNADVLLVPHTVTEFTDSLDPIKAYEYLAARRPVVATPVAGFRQLGLQHVLLAPSGNFPEIVAEALTDPPAVTTQPTLPDWSDRVDAFEQVLAQVVST